MNMPTPYERQMRSKSIAERGGEEIPCTECDETGLMTQKNTRIAGVVMNKHLAERHDPETCGCPRSTVARYSKCIACGGFGSVMRRIKVEPLKTKRGAKR